MQGGVATIDLPDGWRYLQRRDARQVIERHWHYHFSPTTLGLVLPPKETPWGGIVVSYEASGYIDDHASDLDPRLLLEQMREDAATLSVIRSRRGIDPIEISGWADPPHYDPATHKLRWGMELRIGENSTHSYDMRILAADGVLVMKVMGDPSEFPSVVAGARLVLARTELSPGLRHAAHDPHVHTRDPRGMANFFRLATGNRAGPVRVLLRPMLALAVVGIVLAAAGRLPRRDHWTRWN